jgi:ATP-dependent helicase HrpA
VARLLLLGFPRQITFLRQQLALPAPARSWATPFGGSAAVVEGVIQAAIEQGCTAEVRSAEQFGRLAEAMANRWLVEAHALRQQVLQVLEAHAAALGTVTLLEQRVGGKPPLSTFFQQRRMDLTRLAPPDLLERVTPPVLAHLPRYLQALGLRCERALSDFARDQARERDLAALRARFEQLLAALPAAGGSERRAALEEVRWMLEELAVSLFAQELRTARPVSVKRVGQRLAEIAQMA